MTAGLMLGLSAMAGAAPCVEPDNGTGTATLPPLGCPYQALQGPIVISSGLPVGTTLEVSPALHSIVCGNAVCSLGLPAGKCEGPGGSLGGDGQCFQGTLELQVSGTGLLAGFARTLFVGVDGETHSAPRIPGDAVQDFDTSMMLLEGELFGDPDFDMLRITGGQSLGMPSPGHTTLTRLGPPGSDFQVDSFFDITYRIEFQGAPGSVLEGMAGANTGEVRIETGDGTADCGPRLDGQGCIQTVCPDPNDECTPRCVNFDPNTGGMFVTDCECQPAWECHPVPDPDGGLPLCEGECPPGTTCQRTVTTTPTGAVDVCCDCVPEGEEEACCYSDGTCTYVAAGMCDATGGFVPPGGVCLGDGDGNGRDDACEPSDKEDCCFQDGTCGTVAAGTCVALGGTIPAGGFCLGDGNGNGRDDACEPIDEEDCCFQDGTCGPVTAGTCVAMGGSIPSGGFCLGDGNGNGKDDACEPPMRDCCFQDGTCGPVAIGTCIPSGGSIPSGGVCLGDGDGNGYDDACEPDMEDCCFQDGTCGAVVAGTCVTSGGTIPAGGFCLGDGDGNGYDDACEPEMEDCCLPDGSCGPVPVGTCAAIGIIPAGGVCLGDADGNGVDDACEEENPYPFVIEFSLDIGSDKELSDPAFDGDEGFDPGDVYWWQSAPVTPPLVPGGRDGFKDDAFIFGVDPFPAAPDFSVPPATAAPVGNGEIGFYNDWFDLDGHDQLDSNLQQYIVSGEPLEFPITRDMLEGGMCIYEPMHLMISYDDDMAPGWPAADVPVMVPSPAGVSSYGSTATRDEVIALNLALSLPPMSLASAYPVADERFVHADLAPNPDGIEEEDDDVDSLDIVEHPDMCPYWYFSADHEAHLGLDPGSIYLAGAGLLPVVDQVLHLGLIDDLTTPNRTEDADIDAFEFTWMPYQVAGAPAVSALAVIFSVDEDDPLTPGVDESGGLDPNMLYASFMTGSYIPLLSADARPRDDVDALMIWREEPKALLPDCAPTDVDCSGTTNAGDILVVRSGLNWNKTVATAAEPRADVDGSGVINAGDILVIRSGLNWNTSTGPCNCP